jgi:hypothetical protein
MNADLEKSIKAKLRTIAKEHNRDPADLLQILMLETKTRSGSKMPSFAAWNCSTSPSAIIGGEVAVKSWCASESLSATPILVVLNMAPLLRASINISITLPLRQEGTDENNFCSTSFKPLSLPR